VSYEVQFLTTHVDLACNERCLICGVSFTIIREYTLHFEKCKKAADPVKNKSVLIAAQKIIDKLQGEVRENLNVLRESRTSLDEIDIDSEANGTKRKADFPEHPSQRRCIKIDSSTLTPSAGFAQPEATSSRPSMNYSTDTQLNFTCNSTYYPIATSWNTCGTGHDEGSLGSIPTPMMYANEGLGSLEGIQAQGIYHPCTEKDHDCTILRLQNSLVFAKQYSTPM
jgi:hypothetical protein